MPKKKDDNKIKEDCRLQLFTHSLGRFHGEERASAYMRKEIHLFQA